MGKPMPSGKYFSHEELKCRCCGQNKMDDQFLKRLDGFREDLGEPMVVTSGYRCDKYNKKVGGVDFSAHTRGVAVDIAVTDSNLRYELIRVILSKKCDLYADAITIGINSNFVHIEMYHRLVPIIFLY